MNMMATSVSEISQAARSRLRGNTDVINRNEIKGWAFDPANPEHRAQLAIMANSRPICRLSAESYRQDVAQAGIGDGRYGFNVALSELLDPNISYEIRVMREADRSELPGSPRMLHPIDPPSATPFVKTKADITNLLLRKFAFSSYLEICSPKTGLMFGKIVQEALERCLRIVYHCPPDFDDGDEVTWRSTGSQTLCANDDETFTPRKFTLEGVGE